MKKRKYPFTISMVLLAVVAAIPSFLNAETQRFSDLTLDIATTKGEFVKVEPIPIEITLSNLTGATINGHKALKFRHGLIELFTGHNYGEMQKVRNLSPMTTSTQVSAEGFAPGERYREIQLICIELDKVFPEPGLYQIQAVLYDLDGIGRIESNLLDIRIVEPIGLDLDALEYIKRKANPSYFWSGPGLGDQKALYDTFEDFVLNYGDSVYGNYAVLLVGETNFFNGNYWKAIDHLRGAATKENFILADEVLYYLVQANFKVGNIREAGNYFRSLVFRYPDSVYIGKGNIP